MSSRKFALTCSALLLSSAALAQTPHLGQPISEADLNPWDISIGPDGVGLPEGKGTAAEGKPIFEQKCAACHGMKGEGGIADALVGGFGTMKAPAIPVRTVGSYWPFATTVFDFIRRAMPQNAPKSLTPHEVYSVTAYVLHMNGIVAENAVLDKTTLPRVKMPNHDAFTEVYPRKK